MSAANRAAWSEDSEPSTPTRMRFMGHPLRLVAARRAQPARAFRTRGMPTRRRRPLSARRRYPGGMRGQSGEARSLVEQRPARLLDGGAEAYPRMLDAIEAAQRSIRLEVYAFALDGVGERFVAALAAAAWRGVRVTVVLDGWGSAPSGRDVAHRLREAGC